ncbi:L,D-transpeptidase [Rubidibacter lacunae]
MLCRCGLTGAIAFLGMSLPAFAATPGPIADIEVATAADWLQDLSLPGLREPDAYLPAVTPAVHLVIRLSDRRVYLYRHEELEASYPIAIGKDGWETPTGEFEVRQMLVDPAWEHPWTGEVVPPGDGNPLGRRWIGFWTDGTDSIGFHGTPNESLIGQPVSHGCVRMRNADVAALFEQVEVGTPVIVKP